jgi:hypothetical protein
MPPRVRVRLRRPFLQWVAVGPVAGGCALAGLLWIASVERAAATSALSAVVLCVIGAAVARLLGAPSRLLGGVYVAVWLVVSVPAFLIVTYAIR